MPVKVHLASMLARYLSVPPDMVVSADDIGGLLESLDREHRGFRDSICDETGRLRTYVNLFVNDENVSQEREPLSFGLKDGDEVFILANVAGGTG